MIRELMLREYIRSEISRLLDDNVDISKVMQILSENNPAPTAQQEKKESIGYSESIKDIQTSIALSSGISAAAGLSTMYFLNKAAKAGVIAKASQVQTYRTLMVGAATSSTAGFFADLSLLSSLFELTYREPTIFNGLSTGLILLSLLSNTATFVTTGLKSLGSKNAQKAKQLATELDDTATEIQGIIDAVDKDFNKKLKSYDGVIKTLLQKEFDDLGEMNDAIKKLDEMKDESITPKNIDLSAKIRDNITKLYKLAVVEKGKKESDEAIEAKGEAKIDVEAITLDANDIKLMFNKIDELVGLKDKDSMADGVSKALSFIDKVPAGSIVIGIPLLAAIAFPYLTDVVTSTITTTTLVKFGKSSIALKAAGVLNMTSASLLLARAIFIGKGKFFDAVMGNLTNIGEAELSTTLAIINLNRSLRGKKFKLTSSSGTTTYTVLGITPEGVRVSKGDTVNAPPGRSLSASVGDIRQKVSDLKSNNNIKNLTVKDIEASPRKLDILADLIESVDSDGAIFNKIKQNLQELEAQMLSGDSKDQDVIDNLKGQIILDISIYDQHFSSFVGGKESGINTSKLTPVLNLIEGGTDDFQTTMKNAIEASGYDTTKPVEGIFINPYDTVKQKRAAIRNNLVKGESVMTSGGEEVGGKTGGGGVRTNVANLKMDVQSDTVTLQNEIKQTGNLIPFDSFLAGINATEQKEGMRLLGQDTLAFSVGDGTTTSYVSAYKLGAADENYVKPTEVFDGSKGDRATFMKNNGIVFSREQYVDSGGAVYDDSGTMRKMTYSKLVKDNVTFDMVHGNAEADMQTNQIGRMFLGEGGDAKKSMVSFMQSFYSGGNKMFYQYYFYGSVLHKLSISTSALTEKAGLSLSELQIATETFKPEKIEGSEEDIQLFMMLLEEGQDTGQGQSD